jgi:bifunctional DNA-binding transcriptional regulator/antitoxin component of YhaV-PrlF toxin-antitoxin module
LVVLRIKLTSKRQATFPAEVCKQLGIDDGDTLELQPLRYKRETVWVLKPIARLNRPWIGCLRKYAKKANRPWTREEHEEGIGRAWAKESGK